MSSKIKDFIDGNKQEDDKRKGLVFDIQRFVLYDGQGIRTLVFMKGCPLRCKWCSNPESQQISPEIMVDYENCLNCYECLKVCHYNSQFHNEIPTECTGCGKCSDVCYSNARKKIGDWVDVKDLLKLIEKDMVYYKNSNGGVTVGGGEPTMQSEFLVCFLKECKKNGINTAIETCGYINWEKMSLVLDYTDLLLFDIKHIDSNKHKKYTGVSNQIILNNAINASNYVKEMIIRIPLIPKFNTSDEDINLIAKFIKEKLNNVKRVEILPYHSMGESKAKKLGKKYELHGLETLSKGEVNKIKLIFQSYELDVKLMN